MPGGDYTGPMGMGSRTGRGAGFCSGSGMPGYANSGFGRGGFGFRRGAGRGMGRRFFGPAGYGAGVYDYEPAAYPGPVEAKQALKAEADALKRRLDEINARLDALSPKNKTDEPFSKR